MGAYCYLCEQHYNSLMEQNAIKYNEQWDYSEVPFPKTQCLYNNLDVIKKATLFGDYNSQIHYCDFSGCCKIAHYKKQKH